MKEGFRQAMAWLHTWSGLVLGWVLFAMFLTGTLAYFRPEITLWMQPEVQRSAVSSEDAATTALTFLAQRAPDAVRWQISLPDERDPLLKLFWHKPTPEGEAPRGRRGTGRRGTGRRGNFGNAVLDPATGAELKARETRGGDFFYRFHFELQLNYPWGRWLASIAAMAMLIAIVSGIIPHKKFFKDFFTFRPQKGGQRASLDAHNITGVLALPFNLMITYSGLVIFMHMVMPVAIVAAYDSPQQFFDELFPSRAELAAAGVAAPLAPIAPIAPMLRQAGEQFDGAGSGRLVVDRPLDANARVTIYPNSDRRVTYYRGEGLTFDGVSGELRSTPGPESAAAIATGLMYGLHMGHFAGAPLRWLYFLCSLAGTAMVATGLLLWAVKRRRQHAALERPHFGLRLVDSLNLATIAGICVATAVFFWANRLLPAELAGRSGWEVRAFFSAWGLALLHALLRPSRRGWMEQLVVAAALFCALPLLNAFTTDVHLGASLPAGDWVRAGFDLTAFVTGLLLAWCAWKAGRPRQPLPRREKQARRAAPASSSLPEADSASQPA